MDHDAAGSRRWKHPGSAGVTIPRTVIRATLVALTVVIAVTAKVALLLPCTARPAPGPGGRA